MAGKMPNMPMPPMDDEAAEGKKVPFKPFTRTSKKPGKRSGGRSGKRGGR